MAARRLSRSWAEEERVSALVKRCADARQLKQVYTHLVVAGQSQSNFLIAKLVRAFAELGKLDEAREIAGAVESPNVFVWTALIRGHSQPQWGREAVVLYRRMHRECPDIKPLPFTLSSVLKACAHMSALSPGMQIHAHSLKHGFRSDARVQTTLIDLYGNCGRVAEARQVFDRIIGRDDVQAWNTMIAGYARAGDMESARSLFDRMPERNSFTLVEMVSGYSALGRMDQARALFDMAASASGPVASTAMITGYAKCGDIWSARSIFDAMSERVRDVACWNAMISAYAHAHLHQDALGLFKQMLRSSGVRVTPNHATLATVISACSQSGSPALASWIQGYIDSCCGSHNSYTVAALIDLHSKCGDVVKAYHIFCEWTRRQQHKDLDLICYSSMIGGFAIHGRADDAIKVFDELLATGLKPDAICFISVLTACSHAGRVEEGRRYLKDMKDRFGIAPTADHYMCVVDMLGRAGRVEDAYRVITTEMIGLGVRPHAGVWGALLSACRTKGNHVEVGEAAARQLIELEPENTGNYVLLSNIYARAGRWEGVARVREEMRRRGMRKPPGWSWVCLPPPPMPLQLLLEEENKNKNNNNMEEEEGMMFFTNNMEGQDSNTNSNSISRVDELEMVLKMLSWDLHEQGYKTPMDDYSDGE